MEKHGNVSINDFKWNTHPCLSFSAVNRFFHWIPPVAAALYKLVLCHAALEAESRSILMHSSATASTLVFRYLSKWSFFLTRSTETLKLSLIQWKETWAACQWQDRYVKTPGADVNC